MDAKTTLFVIRVHLFDWYHISKIYVEMVVAGSFYSFITRTMSGNKIHV